MQMRKTLGRGLDSLIPATETKPPKGLPTEMMKYHERIRSVPIDFIMPNRMQPRKIFDEAKIAELSNSIREQGIIQPLIVVSAATDRYELIAGERRLRAAKMAGLSEVPVIIKNVDSEGMLELSIIENIQREDLNAIEVACAYNELIKQFDYSQEEVADKLGKSRAAVANSLRLLSLPKLIQDDIVSGRMTAGHARAILGISDLQQQLKLRENILHSTLTVRDVERMVQDFKPRITVSKRAASLTPQMKHIVEEMTQALATKVKLEQNRDGKSGRVVIEYYSAQDLDRVYNMIVK